MRLTTLVYNNKIPVINNRIETGYYDTFVGTITVDGTIYDTNDGTGDKWTYSSNPLGGGSNYIYLDGTGVKRVQLLIVGEGGDGGNSSSGSSGAGGAGGEIKYFADYELTPGYYYFSANRQGILDDSVTGFKKGNSNTSDPNNLLAPFDISCSKGGAVAGPGGVSGTTNGTDGNPGSTYSITGSALRFGWSGGSGACIAFTNINQVVNRTGGVGLPGIPPAVDDGSGNDAERGSDNTVTTYGCGGDGMGGITYGFGHGGGGASAVYAWNGAAYQWYFKSDCGVNNKGQGGAGAIILRWIP